ncbi:helicase associated domain-containing protein [Streptomyces sp. LS1784]|uniref:helicase associated domain-containing protein n=1 Tax=Streptomyces sp. LS1784 TaxID=2851533 RepID=UPI0035A8CA6C
MEWQRMHAVAAVFHVQHGHLDPTDRTKHAELISWLARQRHLGGQGLVDAARVSELDAFGMTGRMSVRTAERCRLSGIPPTLPPSRSVSDAGAPPQTRPAGPARHHSCAGPAVRQRGACAARPARTAASTSLCRACRPAAGMGTGLPVRV